MDDLYPGTADMDPATGRPVSHTTREDLLRIAAEEGYRDIPEGIEEPAALEWTHEDFEDGMLARVLEESRRDALERGGGAGSSREVDQQLRIIEAERLTRIEWEARVSADYRLWTLRQARIRQVQDREAERALQAVCTGRLPSAPVLPSGTSIASRVLEVPRQRRRVVDLVLSSSSDSD